MKRFIYAAVFLINELELFQRMFQRILNYVRIRQYQAAYEKAYEERTIFIGEEFFLRWYVAVKLCCTKEVCGQCAVCRVVSNIEAYPPKCIDMSHFRFDILKGFLSIPELRLHDFEGLLFACRYGIYELAAYLLAHWSGPNNPAADIPITDGNYSFNALNNAVKIKDSRLVRLILDHPQTVIENHPILSIALGFYGTPEIIQMFINYHPLFFQNMDTDNFDFLLREMIVQEFIEIVEQLIKDKILRMPSIISAAGINNPAILKMILSRPIAFSSEREYVLWDIRTAYSVVRSPEVLKILMSDPRMDPTIDAFNYMSLRLCEYQSKYHPTENEQIKLLQVLFTDPRMDSEIHFRKAYQRGDIDQLRQLIYIRPQLLFYAKESGMLGDGLDETLEVLQQYLIDLETITKVPLAIIAEKVLPFITFPSHTWKIETIHETIFGCLKFY